MNETGRFVAIFITACFTLAAFYYVSSDSKKLPQSNTLNNGSAAHRDSSSGSDDRFTYKKYESIDTGMTYEEVFAVLQSHGTIFHQDDEHAVYRWTLASEILLVTFRGEKVSDKSFGGNLKRLHGAK